MKKNLVLLPIIMLLLFCGLTKLVSAQAVDTAYFVASNPSGQYFAGFKIENTTGNIFLTASSNQNIVKITKTTGAITTFAGGGATPPPAVGAAGIKATLVKLNAPSALDFDTLGNLYFIEQIPGGAYSVYKVDVAGNLTTLVTTSLYIFISDIGLDGAGNIFLAAGDILKIAAGQNTIQTITNSSSTKINASSIAVTTTGDIYTIAANHTTGATFYEMFKLPANTSTLVPIAIPSSLSSLDLFITALKDGSYVYATATNEDNTINSGIVRYNTSKQTATTMLGGAAGTTAPTATGIPATTASTGFAKPQLDGNGNVYYLTSSSIFKVLVAKSSVLPLKFISFTGYASDGINTINWVVSDAADIKEYQVQRATDNGVTYTTIAIITADNIQNTYSYKEGIADAYYRIVAISKDATTNTSSFLHLASIRNNNSFNVSILYPVPTSKKLNIVINSPTPTSVTYTIVNVSGKTVMVQKNTAAQGQSTQQLNVSALSYGTYILKINTDAGYTYSTKFTKI